MRKVIPTNVFHGLMWVLFLANVALALYWVATDSGLYRPLADAADSLSIGFFASLIVLLSAQFVVTLPLRAIAKVPSVDERLARLAKR